MRDSIHKIIDEPIRVLMIGAGKMGRVHTPAFQALPGVRVVGVVSGRGETAKKLATDNNIPQWGTNWKDLAEETKANACVVCVSHPMNEPMTAEVIDYGLHVLSEKPVAFTSKEILALAIKAKQKGVVAMAAMNRRFFPSITSAIDVIRFYGPIMGVTVIAPDPIRPTRALDRFEPETYDKWFRANTLHAIDLLRMVGGDVAWISGEARYQEEQAERSIVASLGFCNGALGNFIHHSPSEGWWELRIHGDGVEAKLTPLDQGTITFGNGDPRPLISSWEPSGFKLGLPSQARAFVETIRDEGELAPPVSDLFDHAKTMELIESLETLTPGNLVSMKEVA